MNRLLFKYQYLIIIIICLIAFAPIIKSEFINYDDPYYVLNNPYITKLGYENIKQIFTGKSIDLYIPLTILSYSIDYSISGISPMIFHTSNLILHILNVILLLHILGKINYKNEHIKYIITLFFAISPLVTESVCWVTERKDVLYVLFYLLSINQYLNFETTKKNKNIILCFIFFILACLSKPMAISLPVLLTLYTIYQSKLILKKIILYIPFYLISILFSIITIYRFNQLEISKTVSIPDYSLFESIMILFSEIGFYFFKPFLPIKQSLFHIFPQSGNVFSNTSLLVFCLLGMGVISFMIWLVKTKNNKPVSYLFFVWIAFIFPILQIIPNTHTYVSERYFYLSIIFPVAIIFLLIENKLKDASMFKPIFICLCVLFTFTCFNRSRAWKNTETLFAQELKLNPENTIALNNLAMYFNSKENYNKAYHLFKKLNSIETNNERYLSNYGITLSKLGQTDSAIIYLEKSLAINKNNYEAFSNLGICYIQNHEREKAFPCFLSAYHLNPENAEITCNLGIYYFNSKQFNKALPLLVKAQKLGSTKALKYLNILQNN